MPKNRVTPHKTKRRDGPYAQLDRLTVRPDIDLEYDTFQRIEILSLYWGCKRSHLFRMLIEFSLPAFENSMRLDAEEYWTGIATPDVLE